MASVLLSLPMLLSINIDIYTHKFLVPGFVSMAAFAGMLLAPLVSIAGLVTSIRGLTSQRDRKRSIGGLCFVAVSWLLTLATMFEFARAVEAYR